MAATRVTVPAATVAGVVWLAALMPAAALAQTAADTAALSAFTERVAEYARFRARIEAPLPSLEDRRYAWGVLLTRRFLASALRTARPQAHLGALFTPPVADAFRRLIATRLAEVDVEGLSGWDEDLGVDIVVHEPVPAWSRLAVPGEFTRTFPGLPDGLEYRMVNGALVLWDAHAEFVVDALPAAFMAH